MQVAVVSGGGGGDSGVGFSTYALAVPLLDLAMVSQVKSPILLHPLTPACRYICSIISLIM